MNRTTFLITFSPEIVLRTRMIHTYPKGYAVYANFRAQTEMRPFFGTLLSKNKRTNYTGRKSAECGGYNAIKVMKVSPRRACCRKFISSIGDIINFSANTLSITLNIRTANKFAVQRRHTVLAGSPVCTLYFFIYPFFY